MRILTKLLALSLFGLASFPQTVAHAADPAYISVGQAKTRKSVIAFPALKTSTDAAPSAQIVHETVSDDLAFMDLFQFLSPKAFVEPQTAGIAQGSFKYSDWGSVGADFVIKAQLTRSQDSLVLEAYLHDIAGGHQILAKRYIASVAEAKTLGHSFANDIMQTLTGAPGIFLTKIAMSCERQGRKEIYIMNFDGTDARQITRHRSIAFAPAWSPDGSKLAYSLFVKRRDNNKNIDLYEYDFNTSEIRLLSNRRGMNSGAAYSPDGSRIALTMSFLENPEIFTLDPATRQVFRLTKNFGMNTDPAWSPDGKKIAFLSSRSGKAMVYTMGADGSSPQRLTYAGQYNATPGWAPKGDRIVFAGYLDGHFDIFTMRPDGSDIERLTKGQRNNEDPSYSPDGAFIVFSSNRTGSENVYAMNTDGTYVKRLTYGLGRCVAPKWSNPPRSR